MSWRTGGPLERSWSAQCRTAPDRPFFHFGSVEAEGWEQARILLVDRWLLVGLGPVPMEFWPVPGAVLFHSRAPRDGEIIREPPRDPAQGRDRAEDGAG